MHKKRIISEVGSMESDNNPCYAADTLRCIRQIPINRISTGIPISDECVEEAQMQNLKTGPEIRSELIKWVKRYNNSHGMSRANMFGRFLKIQRYCLGKFEQKMSVLG